MPTINLAVNMLIFDSQSRILLVKRSPKKKLYPSYWSIPGGQVEEGETVDEALDREIDEELSVKIVTKEYFTSTYTTFSPEFHMRAIYFFGTVKGDIQINEEAIEWKWFPLSKIEANKEELAFNQNAILRKFALKSKQ